MGCGMKRLAAAFVVMIVPVAQAQEPPRQFNLECKDVGRDGKLEDEVSLVIYVDLDRKLSCREWLSSCIAKPLVDHGRWIDLSYAFKRAGVEDYEMYRLYDRNSGWLDQVVRRVGHHGSPYGDAVCAVTAYTPFSDNSVATPPTNIR